MPDAPVTVLPIFRILLKMRPRAADQKNTESLQRGNVLLCSSPTLAPPNGPLEHLLRSAGSPHKPMSIGMNNKRNFLAPQALLLGALVLAGLSGCQSNIGGQTLPSAYYLRDDVQFFPAGPEFLLPNTVRAMEEYKATQAAAAAGPVPPVTPAVP